jgi:Late exocytosis, associated with Golgi transport
MSSGYQQATGNEVVWIGSYRRRLDWLLPAWLEDADAFDQSINEDMLAVGYTIAANVIIFTICVLTFSIYRMHDAKIYAPKSDLLPDKTPPKIPNDTMFGWIGDLYAISDDVLIDKGGYDILFLIRFYRLSFKVFLGFSIYAWGVLLPING